MSGEAWVSASRFDVLAVANVHRPLLFDDG